MKLVTLRRWLALSADQREVQLDEVLEALPEGFIHARDVGHAPATVPQFIHQDSGVMFHLVFGDRALLGMSERRFRRVAAVRRSSRRWTGDDEDLPEPVPAWEDVSAFSPAREVEVPPALVGEVLSAYQLHLLGVPEGLLAAWGLRPGGVGTMLRGLTRRGWRLPSEVEWEYACRAGVDALSDEAPPVQPALRFLTDLGARAELCRDSWHATWAEAPATAEPWGEGHEVVRGGGGWTGYTSWDDPPAWAEAVWPVRRRLEDTSAVGVRPWVSL